MSKWYFPGVVVFGLNNKDPLNAVAVYKKGMILNDEQFRRHQWPNWGADPKRLFRHYFVAPNEVEIMTKKEICDAMGIKRLVNYQQGHRPYNRTPIGDVLYITYDTNRENWVEAQRIGFIDKKCGIHQSLFNK